MNILFVPALSKVAAAVARAVAAAAAGSITAEISLALKACTIIRIPGHDETTQR